MVVWRKALPPPYPPLLLCSSFLSLPQPEEKENQTGRRRSAGCSLGPAVSTAGQEAKLLGSPESNACRMGFNADKVNGVRVSTALISGRYKGLVLKLSAL